MKAFGNESRTGIDAFTCILDSNKTRRSFSGHVCCRSYAPFLVVRLGVRVRVSSCILVWCGRHRRGTQSFLLCLFDFLLINDCVTRQCRHTDDLIHPQSYISLLHFHMLRG